MSRKKISPHFWLDEFACGCCGSSGDKKNIIQLTSRLEMLRRRWNKPMKIVGGHRCLKSNPHGATNAHYLCKGADISVEGVSEERVAKAARAFFTHVVVGKGFVHVDYMPKGYKQPEAKKDGSNKSDPKPRVKRKLRKETSKSDEKIQKPKATRRRKTSKKEKEKEG